MKRPVRVLQVVAGMDRGGIESWLMHVIRNTDRRQMQCDFLYTLLDSCEFDREILSLGSRIHRIRCHHRNLWGTWREFRSLLRSATPAYDVIHSHCGWYSGFVMAMARRASVPVRIAHVHHDMRSAAEHSAAWRRRLYDPLMRLLVRQNATHGFACSERAADSFFGPKWRSEARWSVLHCGIDLTPYSEREDADRILHELNIPDNAFVLGHVGRFSAVKNHAFIVRVFSELVQMRPSSRLLLVGDGPLRADIEKSVARAGLSEHVVFAGIRTDVPRLLRSIVDAVILPSLREGMPLVAIEAQAAGRPLFLTDSITRELEVVPALCHWLPLSGSPQQWASEILEASCHDAVSPTDAFDIVSNSSFNISRCCAQYADMLTTAMNATLAPSRGIEST